MLKIIPPSLIKLLNTKAALILLIISITGIRQVQATHATGADLTYQSLGNNQYQITFTFYRDCNGIEAPQKQALYISSYLCNYIDTVLMNRVPGTGVEITRTCSTAVSTCNGGSVVGIQQWKYTQIVTLPFRCADWQFYTMVANRNASITTIINPDANALYVEAFLNNTTNDNNSPTFSNAPIAFECIGQTNNFNQGVIDADGDSLVYSFIAPRKNSNSNLFYKTGYSVANPIASSPPVSINSINGDITMNPIHQDIAAVAVLIQEYRNGKIIGSVMRDMQLYIVSCSNTLPNLTGMNGSNKFATSKCVGGQICFDVLSNDADQNQNLTLSWNNSIPGATFTTTSSQHPVGHFCWAPTPSQARAQPYTFSVTVRDNACPSNGIQTYSYSILVSNLRVQLTATPGIQCYGSHNGSAAAIVSGIPPFQYTWTLPNGNILTTQSVSHLSAGNYNLNVTDANGCLGSKYFTITQPPPLTVALTASNTDCGGGLANAVANVTGGTPSYSYLWSPGGQTVQNAIGLSTNIYTVKVTDDHGCISSASTNVQSNIPVTFVLELHGATCTANNGSATVTHTGGSGNFSYKWTPDIPGNNLSSTITGLVTGLYSVVATDLGTGCSQTLSGIVQNLSGITATITSTINATCESGEDGFAAVVATGGEAPYYYEWPNGDVFSTTNHMSPGTFLVRVEDYNGCSAYAQGTIGYDHVSPVVDLGRDTMPSTGIPFLIVAGNGYDSYLWNNGSTNSSILTTISGTYSALVTNTYGCETFDAIKVTFVNRAFNNGKHTSKINSLISIFPNPADDELNIQINRVADTEVTLTMTDILGNTIFQSKEKSETGYSKKVNMLTFPAGIYLIRIEYDNEINTTRIIKH